jgi:hypothetical protein
VQKGFNRDDGIEQMIQQGGRVNLNNPELRPEPAHNFRNRPMHFNNQPNMPAFMNEQIMSQNFNPMMIQQQQMHSVPMQIMQPNMMNMQFPPMNAISPPIPTNIFANPLEIMPAAPLPVPPPQPFEAPIRAPGTDFMDFSQISPPIMHNNFNPNGLSKQPVTIVRENAERPPRKKVVPC